MRWRKEWTTSVRPGRAGILAPRAVRLMAVVCAASTVGSLLLTQAARAGERQFLVILATSPKQFGGGLPPGGLPNPQLIRQQYFDKINANIDSFAEYWPEISYGDVRISGDITEWINLPWVIGPQDGAVAFIDLNGNGIFEFGVGEDFSNDVAMVAIDVNGDGVADNGLFPFARGGGDTVPGTDIPVWMPGERFADIDGDGMWDGLDEANNEMDFFPLPNGDGQPDLLGPWFDLNQDGATDNPANCIYLPDSDNDRNPDCCPDGPGTPGCAPFDPTNPAAGACPPTTWDGPNNTTIIDCNGNLIDDAIDIASGTSMDRLPLSAGDTMCDAETNDGIPDECQFVNFNVDCVAMPAAPMSPCVNMPVCDASLGDSRTNTAPRCEFDDSNNNGELDIVEPFENFLRTGDANATTKLDVPVCKGGTNNGKLCTQASGCPGGTCVGNLADRQYIIDNYPGDPDKVLSQQTFRTVQGRHDPNNKLGTACMCADGSLCNPNSTNGLCDAGEHSEYNPPDRWIEVDSSKMARAGFVMQNGVFVQTTEPEWYKQAWVDRFGTVPPPWRFPDAPAFAPDATPMAVPLDVAGRRSLLADRGGVNGDGTGSFDGFPVLPEESNGIGMPLILYDGPVEFDDLPSSKYHRGGNQRLGEVTSPFNNNIWGEDRGDNDPGTTADPDDIIEAAGPYATSVHANFGRDAGNVLHMEMLTFGKKDRNLDRMVDQGEFPTGSSNNYLGGPVPSDIRYPWNRDRLVEDCIEIVDDVLDFDDFVDTVALDRINCVRDSLQQGLLLTSVPLALRGGEAVPVPPGGEPAPVSPVIANGVLSGIVLLPAGASTSDEFNILPGFFPIHNEDGLGDPAFLDANLPRVDSPSPPGFVPTIPFEPQISWNIFFHNWVRPLDAPGAGADPGTTVTDFQVRNSAQAYLFSWEGFPFLFDFDVFDAGAIENCPIGLWDIMANGGLVHPVPILKEKVCTEWIKPVDLTTVLTPGVDAVLTLPPAEFVRDQSYFFLENEKRRGERYYFWSAGAEGSFDEPRLNAGMPGEGMLVMHTDVGPDGTFSNLDALSQQQRSGTRPAFLIVQADGNNDLQACSTGGNRGDAGDPYPGITDTTRFNFDTVPAATWFTQNSWTGIDVLDVEPDGSGSVRLTINWVPTTIPSLRFIDPPGGQSVGSNFQVRFQATDVFGGTTIRLFFTEDKKTCNGTSSGSPCMKNSDCPTGQLCRHNTTIGSSGVTEITAPGMPIRKTTPGTNQLSTNWNIAGIADGRYVLFAKLTPGVGADGTEDASTTPRPGRNNVGNGTLTVDAVDIAGNKARFETWTAECIDPDCDDWLVSSSLSQPTPAEGAAPPNAALAHPSIAYTSIGGEVKFTITQGSVAFALGDTFTFTTTGVTAVSRAVTIAGGRITEGPIAVITAMTPESGPLSGPPPLTVIFDGRNSIDPNGEPLDCLWNFGDGSPTTTGCLVTHTYDEAGLFPATLTVTNPLSGLFGEATVDINVINNSPNAAFTATPTSGPTPLQVQFDASQSSDTETPEDELIYQWNFGDGTAANDQAVGKVGNSNPFIETEHTYSTRADGTACTPQNPCTFNATLTVTDELGKEDTATVQILVGNTKPVASFTASPQEGPAPLPVEFDASSSSDADGDDLTVTWDFGDGTALVERSLTGANAMPVITHTYTATGTFLPTATVRDGVNRGQAIAGGVTIEVTGNLPPMADFLVSPETGIAVATEFRFDGRASSDPDGSIVSYAWNFGDGSPIATDAVVTHRYALPKLDGYRVRLTVTDDRDASNTKTRIVVVEINPGNQPPVAIIVTGLRTCAAPCTLSFDARLSSDPNGDPLVFTWEFRRGGVIQDTRLGAQINQTFDTPGEYTVELVVSDGRGGVSRAGPETILITTNGAFPAEPPPTASVPGDGGVPDSALQRPPRICGFGMLMSLFGSLLGLSMMVATRRRLRL